MLRRFAEDREWMLHFLDESDKLKGEWQSDDREVIRNWMVLPNQSYSPYGRTNITGRSNLSRIKSKPILKDPETHQVIETWRAKILLTTIGQEGFVQSKPTGREDAGSSMIMNKLMQRTFRQPGNFRELYVSVGDCLLQGATVIAPRWKYQTGKTIRRVRDVDIETGAPFWRLIEFEGPTRDDPHYMAVPLDDWFPQPGADTVEKMYFGATRFFLPEHEVERQAEALGWNMEAVRRALHEGAGEDRESADDTGLSGLSLPNVRNIPESYKTVVGYDGWGETPYLKSDKQRRRRIVMLNGHVVASEPSPIAFSRRVPWCDLVVNPINGSWRGLSPGIIMRYSQDLADAVLTCLAMGVQRRVDPPVLYDGNDYNLDLDKLKAWRGPIKASSVNAVKEIQYDPHLGDGLQFLQLMKQIQREGTGATGSIQGLGFGTKRMTAQESRLTFGQAVDRPEMAAVFFEQEHWPSLAMHTAELLQQFVVTPDDIARRVGAIDSQMLQTFTPEILDGHWDFEFVGSRSIESKEVQLQFLERSMQVAASVPGLAPMYPWVPALIKWMQLADLRDLETMVGNPKMVEQFMLASFAMGQMGGGGNPQASGQAANPASVSVPELAGVAAPTAV